MKFLKKLIAKLLLKKATKQLQKYVDMKSINTTIGGVIAALGLLFTQVGYLFDNDAMTNPDYGVIIAAFAAAWALFKARDDKVTSEAAGAK